MVVKWYKGSYDRKVHAFLYDDPPGTIRFMCNSKTGEIDTRDQVDYSQCFRCVVAVKAYEVRRAT